MSWSAMTGTVLARNAASALRKNYFEQSTPRTPDAHAQFEAAVRALETTLTVVQPDLDGLVSVAASGHANLDHRPAAGWANDCFSLTITQITA